MKYLVEFRDKKTQEPIYLYQVEIVFKVHKIKHLNKDS